MHFKWRLLKLQDVRALAEECLSAARLPAICITRFTAILNNLETNTLFRIQFFDAEHSCSRYICSCALLFAVSASYLPTLGHGTKMLRNLSNCREGGYVTFQGCLAFRTPFQRRLLIAVSGFYAKHWLSVEYCSLSVSRTNRSRMCCSSTGIVSRQDLQKVNNATAPNNLLSRGPRRPGPPLDCLA